MERNIVVLIDTNGECPNFEEHIELTLHYGLKVEFQKFTCILCAHQYLIENHEKVLLAWIRPYGTICSESAHTEEDRERYTQLKGVHNFYDRLIQSDGINRIPLIIMHANEIEHLNARVKRPNDMFLGFDSMLPSEFCKKLTKLLSQE